VDLNAIGDMSAAACISIVLADDHPLVLQGAAEVLSAQTDMNVLAMCTDGRAAAEVIRQFAPDVAVLDMVMPGLNGLEVLSAITGEKGFTKFVFLTAFATDDHILAAIANGAQGIVLKEAAPDCLVECVRTVAAGRQCFPRELVEAAVCRDASRRAESDRFGLLTWREQRIVALVADGLSNKEIARRANLSEGTIKIYLHTIYEKLETPNRTALAALAIGFRHRLQSSGADAASVVMPPSNRDPQSSKPLKGSLADRNRASSSLM
jgi:two-component system nitrate/nitrite response regulator NarL